MKVAITASDTNIDHPIDSRFGRCNCFVIYDLESDDFRVIGNEEVQQMSGGAGVQAAEQVANNGVDAVVTGHCGPKAFSALNAVGIKVYTAGNSTSVREAVNRLKQSELTELHQPSGPSHMI